MDNRIPQFVDTQFIEYLDRWQAALPVLALQEAVPDPDRAAILSVDMVNGFCSQGPLASPRVARIAAPIARLFERAWEYGIRQIVLAQDTHEPQAEEFAQWPPHCVRGTSESQTVPEIAGLPFYDRMTVIPKNSINAALNTALPEWMGARPTLETYIVVGDCTDLCVYQLAMYLRLDANAHQVPRRVLLPADCVDTYDLPVDEAARIGALPHPADLIHPFFLFHMAMNGVEVVRSLS